MSLTLLDRWTPKGWHKGHLALGPRFQRAPSDSKVVIILFICDVAIYNLYKHGMLRLLIVLPLSAFTQVYGL